MTMPSAVILAKPECKPCPVCGSAPYIEECEPRGAWAVGCYKMVPREHFVGVNGDNQLDAIRNWNIEVGKIDADAETASK